MTLLIFSGARAAPPEDFSVPQSTEQKSSQNPSGNLPLEKPAGAPKRITEDDLLYSHPSEENEEYRGPLGIVKRDSQGRSLPNRNGKVLAKLKAGEKVQVIKTSKDKRWLAIFILKLRQKAWIPANNVEIKNPEKK